jgi:hypothetical protein
LEFKRLVTLLKFLVIAVDTGGEWLLIQLTRVDVVPDLFVSRWSRLTAVS